MAVVDGGSSSVGCELQTTKKYMTRPSPPYPANQCCTQVKTGNNGQMFLSKEFKNGVCRWVPQASTPQRNKMDEMNATNYVWHLNDFMKMSAKELNEYGVKKLDKNTVEMLQQVYDIQGKLTKAKVDMYSKIAMKEGMPKVAKLLNSL